MTNFPANTADFLAGIKTPRKKSLTDHVTDALIRFVGDADLNKHIRALSDNESVSGKIDGDMWFAAARLQKLSSEDLIISGASIDDVRSALKRAMTRCGYSTKQRLAALAAPTQQQQQQAA